MAEQSSTASTKKRKENWTKSEVTALRSSYIERCGIIDGRLGSKLHAADKERCWREIEDSVNSQGMCIRRVEECKKKLSDMKTEVKKRERRRRQMAAATGGGPAPVLEDWEEKMVQVIGESAIGGFAGIDTFRPTSTCTSGNILESQHVNLAQSMLSEPIYSILDTEMLEADCPPPLDITQTPSNPVETVNRTSQSHKDSDEKDLRSLIREQNCLLEKMLEQQRITNDLLMASMTLKN